eukprot:CAMPEP_0201638338 /NCGR_PEP_ID=MMETSP0493-20130528/16290_1 /ASSEMBLY_ACC=CAM_ASM_000838 /TAXON_ID=420259 /ORGANISM="Thalassiosira gravida, Strain GMp14c1" /LENGTH=71 /DNA_ID=CAMNT_0048111329 /DNA_START=258 /DNA_END=469 /DNA_ORIENTATION=+
MAGPAPSSNPQDSAASSSMVLKTSPIHTSSGSNDVAKILLLLPSGVFVESADSSFRCVATSPPAPSSPESA